MNEIETWERLQARLYHLGWLGEELSDFTATPGGAWLYREIAREAAAIATIASAYVTECETAELTGHNGRTPEPRPGLTAANPRPTSTNNATASDIGARTDGGDAA